jgi:hypothetical protein
MDEQHLAVVAQLLDRAKLEADPASFTRYGSARKLYHFSIDHMDEY